MYSIATYETLYMYLLMWEFNGKLFKINGLITMILNCNLHKFITYMYIELRNV